MESIKNKTRFSLGLLVGTLILISLSACSLTADGGMSTADATPVIKDDTPTNKPGTVVPVETPEITDVPATPGEDSGQDFTDVIEDPVFAGVMVLNDGQFATIDLFAQPMGFAVDALNTQWVLDPEIGVTKNSVFLSSYDGLVLADMNGRQLVSFAGTRRVSSVDVSRDGSLLAWVSEEVIDNGVQFELWVANSDGSNPVLAYELSAERTRVEPLAIDILGWTADNQVIFATRADGIGGYILYAGWTDLFAFDPAIPGITHQYLNDGSSRMCVNSVSDDFSLVATGCQSIQIQNLATAEVLDLPAVAEQNFAGSAKFSPSGMQVAYSIGRGDPENEYSQLLVAPLDGGSPLALDTIEGGYFTVLGWADENTVLYSASAGVSGVPTIWRIETDGNMEPFKITDGQFMGIIY